MSGPGDQDLARARVQELLREAASQEMPQADTCLGLARAYEKLADPSAATRWAYAASDASDDLAQWMSAGALVRRCLPLTPALPRAARIAVLGSYTTTQLASILPLACARTGVSAEIYECGYGQYQQEVLNPSSGLYAFAPDVVVMAVHAGELNLPQLSADPVSDVQRESARWTRLWQVLLERTNARVVQHLFALTPETALGHLGVRTPGARQLLEQRVNTRLGEAAAAAGVVVVDCDRLSATVGKDRWFDARYWHRSKQAVSLSFVPLLARHTAAVIAAALGQSRKCLVLDLDNTLWGGVLGEEGLAGIRLADGPVGEAFSAFQAYILELERRGVVLAVCSKNNHDDAVEVFEKHPDMLLTLDDIAMFSANWDDKATQLRTIASTLGLGLDALVFVDDNPAEREVVRQLVPEVDVVALPRDPAGYVRALSQYLLFEPSALTVEDADRTDLYRAKARTAQLEQSTSSLDEFLRSLDMVATVTALDVVSTPRVAQLIGKTNQFNLTGRRRSPAQVAALVDDPTVDVLCVRLRDRFADHGLVGVLIGVVQNESDSNGSEAAQGRGATYVIDTWLMSCRVIGRTLEDEMLQLAVSHARALGCADIRGEYTPTPKNALVSGLYERLGFQPENSQALVTTWSLPVEDAPTSPGFISIDRSTRSTA